MWSVRRPLLTVAGTVMCLGALLVVPGCPTPSSPPPPSARLPTEPPSPSEPPPRPTDPTQPQSSTQGPEQRREPSEERSEQRDQPQGEQAATGDQRESESTERPEQEAGASGAEAPDADRDAREEARETRSGGAGVGTEDGDDGGAMQPAGAGEDTGGKPTEHAAGETGEGGEQSTAGASGASGSAGQAAGRTGGEEAPTGGASPGVATGNRPGSTGPWSEAGRTKVDELRRGFAVVDGILHEENEHTDAQRDASAPGHPSLREQGMEGSEDMRRGSGSAPEDAEGREASAQGPYGEQPYGEEAEERASGPGGAGGPQARPGTPPDVGDGSDDDVVAQQLRELAERETDPELRDAYWCDYRKYRGLVRDCPERDPER